MGGSVSQVFQSGSALLSNGHGHKVTESTREKVQHIFEALRAKPKVPVALLEGFLQQIPKVKEIDRIGMYKQNSVTLRYFVLAFVFTCQAHN